ncbi:MAG: aminopeptidase, partial [Phycisphaerales bacterium]|nr:aminopeptidase [Phycisphaerales bacterium]
MIDPRISRLADVLVSHSTRLKKGEHVLIETFDAPDVVATALVRAATAAGAHPHVTIRRNRVIRALIENAGDDQLATWGEYDTERMKKMDAYIAIRGSANVSELAGVSADRMQAYGRLYQKPVHFEQRVKHTKWCVLRWP